MEYWELGEKLKVFSGEKTILTVYNEKPIGDLDLRLLDYRTLKALSSLEYSVKGNGLSFSGKTGKKGEILHRDVLAGYYVLTVGTQEHSVPTVDRGDQPYQVWIAINQSEDSRSPAEDERVYWLEDGDSPLDDIDTPNSSEEG